MAERGRAAVRAAPLQRLPRRRARRSARPVLEGVYGTPVPLQEGKDVAFVTADDRYIRDSILLPKSQVVAGYEPSCRRSRARSARTTCSRSSPTSSRSGANEEDEPMSLPGEPSSDPAEDYLTPSYTLKSWLLTTDHKRIGILYMVSITFFFFVGGAAATLMRLELMTPAGRRASSPTTYNRLFTLHGVIMVFFFLIPSIPAVLGNFLVPMMIGARDLAFPKLNLLSWYIYMLGGAVRDLGRALPAASTPAGRSTRRSARMFSNTHGHAGGDRRCSSPGSRRSSPG